MCGCVDCDILCDVAWFVVVTLLLCLNVSLHVLVRCVLFVVCCSMVCVCFVSCCG